MAYIDPWYLDSNNGNHLNILGRGLFTEQEFSKRETVGTSSCQGSSTDPEVNDRSTVLAVLCQITRSPQVSGESLIYLVAEPRS